MNKFATIALPLLSLALATRCGFRFNNPVEQCPPEGCPIETRGDAGHPITGDAGPYWFAPSAKAETVHLGYASSTSIAIDRDEDPFIVMNGSADPAKVKVRAATRKLGQWSFSDIALPSFLWPGVAFDAIGGGAPTSLLFGVNEISAAPDNLFFAEAVTGTWNVYPLVESAIGSGQGTSCGHLRAVSGLGGGIDFIADCGEVMRHGRWDGDRTKKAEIVWEDIGPTLPTGFNSLVGNGAGDLHAVGLDNAAQKLIHVWRAGAAWQREELQHNSNVFPWMALDPSGNVGYCWQEGGATLGSFSATCVRGTSGHWVEKPVFVNRQASFLEIKSLTFDKAGRLVFLALENSAQGGCSVSLWTETGNSWNETRLVERTTASCDESFISPSNLVFDAKGAGHFAFSDGGRLYHVEFGPEDTSGTWFDPSATRQPVTAVDSIGWTSLGIDATDKPFILFGEGSSGTKVRASTPSAGGWQTSDIVLMGADFVSGFAFSGTNPSGFTGHPDLLFFERAESTWSAYPLSSSSGFFASALRSDGTLDAVQLADGAIRYAHWNGDRTSMPALSWADVGTLGASAVPIGLLRDPQDRLHLLAVDPTSQELVYFLQSGGVWSHEVLKSNFAGWATMALDPAGELAYCWSNPGAVVDSVSASCERKTNGLWTTKPLVTNLAKTKLNLLGLTFDSAGRMLVMTTKWEEDLVSSELWRETDSAWTPRLLTRSQGPVCTLSFVSNLALDSTGQAHVAVADCQQVYHLQFAP